MEAKNDKVVVFSVVRDQDMYLRCLMGNHFLKGCVLKKVDNGTDNQPVTKRYNDFLDTQGLNLIDAGHFPTENVVCPAIAAYLKAHFPEVQTVISTSHRDVIQYYL